MQRLMVALLAACLLPCSSLGGLEGPAPAEYPQEIPDSFSFVALGDWGYASKDQEMVAQAMGGAAQAVDAQLVLALGDNFYFQGVTGVDDPKWASVWQARYTHPALQVPWYAILGNHDHYGNAAAQIDFSRLAMDRRWVLPNYFWTTTHTVGSRKLQLVMIDTVLLDEEITRDVLREKIDSGVLPLETLHQFDASRVNRGRLGDELLAWLHETLSSSDADFLVVCGHYPVFSGGEHGSTPSLLAKIKPMLDEFRVDAYLSGHDHTLQHLESDNVDYYVSGNGALRGTVRSLPQTRFAVVRPGFSVHQVSEDFLKTTFIDGGGNALYTHTIARTRTP